MKKLLSIIFLIFILIWLVCISYLTGYLPEFLVPENLKSLKLPVNTSELGDSLALVDSLFASIALVLGLVAILIQGKELKESTKAQTSQAKTLELQIKYQQQSNILGAYSVRQSFLLSDCDRLNKRIEELVVEEQEETDEVKKNKLWEIIRNSRIKEKKQRKEANAIDLKIKDLLETT